MTDRRLQVTAAAIGAWLVLRSAWAPSGLSDTARWWAVLSTIAVSISFVWVLPALRELLPRPGDVPLVLTGALMLTFLCVPETDQILPVGALLTLVTIGEAASGWRLPWWLLMPLALLVLWAGVFGATGRQSALVGAFVAWWPVMLLPLTARWRPGAVGMSNWARGGIVSIGFIAAAAVARTGALEPSIGPALLATAIALPVSLALVAGVTITFSRRPDVP